MTEEDPNPALNPDPKARGRLENAWAGFADNYMDRRLSYAELQFFRLVFIAGACVTFDAFKRGTPEIIADLEREFEAIEEAQKIASIPMPESANEGKVQ